MESEEEKLEKEIDRLLSKKEEEDEAGQEEREKGEEEPRFFLKSLIEDISKVVEEEKDKVATVENIKAMRKRLKQLYLNKLTDLREKGFSLKGFEEDVSEEDIEETIRYFLKELTGFYFLFVATERLKMEFPFYLKEIEEIETKIRALPSSHDGKDMVVKKRELFSFAAKEGEASLLREIGKNLQILLQEEKSQPATLENVIRMKERLRKAYVGSIREMEKRGFSLGAFQEKVSDGEIEEKVEEFINALNKLSMLWGELRKIEIDYPKYRSELEELKPVLKTLSKIEEAEEKLTEKRTIFKIRRLIEEYAEVTEKYKLLQKEIKEMKTFPEEVKIEEGLSTLKSLKKKYSKPIPEEAKKLYSELESELTKRGMEEIKNKLRMLLEMYPELFTSFARYIKLDLSALEIVSEAMSSPHLLTKGGEEYRNIVRHTNEPKFIFLTLKRFVEMELNARAKILGM